MQNDFPTVSQIWKPSRSAIGSILGSIARRPSNQILSSLVQMRSSSYQQQHPTIKTTKFVKPKHEITNHLQTPAMHFVRSNVLFQQGTKTFVGFLFGCQCYTWCETARWWGQIVYGLDVSGNKVTGWAFSPSFLNLDPRLITPLAFASVKLSHSWTNSNPTVLRCHHPSRVWPS